MENITKKELIELRDKYAAGLQSIEADLLRLKNDRTATDGAVKALTALIDSMKPEPAAE